MNDLTTSNDSNARRNDADVYRTLLESTRAIPWKIDWDSMQFSYIGPQIERLLGWRQDSWRTVQDWAERIHVDDRQKTVDFCVAQSQQGVDHEADYRALTFDGDYVWIRDVVHVVRKEDGSVDSLVGFMFDISERRRAEDKILQLQKELEALSYQDGLTAIANRRMFDSLLGVEWAKARATGLPLSLVLIDIDFFKGYNDRHGHPQGDACLKRVARVLDGAASRTRDLCARLGGEEFALLLPATGIDAAARVAQRCRKLLAGERIVHGGSTVSDFVTVSIGVGSIVPGANDPSAAFVEAVDRRLYRAKSTGRDRIVAD